MKKLLIVDDHTMFRQAVQSVIELNAPPGSISCDNAGSADEARGYILKTVYDAIVLDISMPDKSGIDFLPEIKRIAPATPVLILSMYPEEQFALQALRMGAAGYLTKQGAADELLAALATVMDGQRYVTAKLSKQLIETALLQSKPDKAPHEQLSPREQEILRRLAKGDTLKRISDDLGLSIKTVSTYKTRLFHKLGFQNNADLFSYTMSQNDLRHTDL